MASNQGREQPRAPTQRNNASTAADPSPLRIRLSTATAAPSSVAATSANAEAGPSGATAQRISVSHASQTAQDSLRSSRKRSRRLSSASSSSSGQNGTRSRRQVAPAGLIDLSQDGDALAAPAGDDSIQIVPTRSSTTTPGGREDLDLEIVAGPPPPPDHGNNRERSGSSPLPDFSMPVNGRKRSQSRQALSGAAAVAAASTGNSIDSRIDKGKQRALSTLSDAPNGISNLTTTATEEQAQSLSSLQCPICFGSPSPLVLTSCGHAFCGPCLHAALVAGPPLTPPPPDHLHPYGNGRGARGGGRGRGARGRGARGGARGGGGGGPAAEALLNRAGQRRNPRRGNNVNGGVGGAFAEGFVEDDLDGDLGGANWQDDGNDGPPTELDKHCPVCRAPLKGGWGRSLRGLYLRMAPKSRRAAQPDGGGD
ncbi:hypothetical protein ACM66B_005412 [Microbotryomycetes sp. NB124-2]